MKRFAVLVIAGFVGLGFSGESQAAEVDLSNMAIESGIVSEIETEDLSAWPRVRDAMLGREKDRDRRPPPPPPPPPRHHDRYRHDPYHRNPPPPPPPPPPDARYRHRPPPPYHRPPPPPPPPRRR